MHAALAVPFVDTAAGELCFSLAQPPLPAVSELALELQEPVTGRPALMTLRLLGASHQVVLADRAGHPRLVETVACLPGLPAGIPDELHGDDAAPGYRFRSSVQTLGPAAMDDLVRDLSRQCAVDDCALIGHYPGRAAAVTAVIAAPDPEGSVRWQTWHTYPQTGAVVRTRSALLARPDAGEAGR